jgi:quercetin dioxygenase-like cupin family protein
MSDSKARGSVLQACVGKEQHLSEMIAYGDDAIVSKTILDKTAGTVTLFAFDAGQQLSEHTAPYDAIVQVLDGSAGITIGGTEHKVTAGQVIIMPANVPHAVAADERFKMLLIMIRA